MVFRKRSPARVPQLALVFLHNNTSPIETALFPPNVEDIIVSRHTAKTHKCVVVDLLTIQHTRYAHKRNK